ncbi:MAG: hypothetical protein ACTS6P_02160 [Candidatus Hodgkinia cicadicola]
MQPNPEKASLGFQHPKYTFYLSIWILRWVNRCWKPLSNELPRNRSVHSSPSGDMMYKQQ